MEDDFDDTSLTEYDESSTSEHDGTTEEYDEPKGAPARESRTHTRLVSPAAG
jgi:hypothetical protein